MAKSRIAPLKKLTLLSLELMGELIKRIQFPLGIPPHELGYDSSCISELLFAKMGFHIFAVFLTVKQSLVQSRNRHWKAVSLCLNYPQF